VPSFKDLRLKKATFEKFKELIKAVSVARFNYPILMAADILLYKAQKVPIGGDQAAHLEISAEIARKMNKKYKLSLPEPKSFSVIAKDFVLPDLSGKEKMSKSNPEKAIFLNDSRKTIERKIAKITTDTAGKGTKIPESGGVYVLFVFTELFISEKRRKELEKEYLTTGLKYEEIKKEITQAIYKELSLIRKKRKYYDNHPEEVNKILREGARKAEKIASQTLEEVREAMQLA
jgi:tryptophanyl-tRNA synthetase